MPFDCTATDTTTQFLLELRDRLTPENWRPYAISYPLEFQAGKGCLIQQFDYVVRQRGGLPYDSLRSVQRRLIKAARCKTFDRLARFNDRHTLEDVCALVDKAIAG